MHLLHGSLNKSPSSLLFHTSSHTYLPIRFPPSFQGVPNNFHFARHPSHFHNTFSRLKSIATQGKENCNVYEI